MTDINSASGSAASLMAARSSALIEYHSTWLIRARPSAPPTSTKASVSGSSPLIQTPGSVAASAAAFMRSMTACNSAHGSAAARIEDWSSSPISPQSSNCP